MRATEFLTEGGNVFDGTSDIDQKFAPNLTAAINKALTGTGINVITVGSAATPTPGKMSGDFDVMADETAVAEYFGVKDAKSARKALADYFRSKGFDVAQTGTNVHVKTPIGKQFAQVDVMVVPAAEKISKLHIHNLPKGSPYKGYNKQLAIHFLSKMKGYFWSAWQGLFARTSDGKKGELISNDVDAIAKELLGPQATAADLGSVESIMKALPKDQADQLMATLKADPNWKEVAVNEATALNLSKLTKREGRVDIFLNLIKQGHVFKSSAGNIKIDPATIPNILKDIQSNNSRMTVQTVEKKTIPLGSIYYDDAVFSAGKTGKEASKAGDTSIKVKPAYVFKHGSPEKEQVLNPELAINLGAFNANELGSRIISNKHLAGEGAPGKAVIEIAKQMMAGQIPAVPNLPPKTLTSIQNDAFEYLGVLALITGVANFPNSKDFYKHVGVNINDLVLLFPGSTTNPLADSYALANKVNDNQIFISSKGGAKSGAASSINGFKLPETFNNSRNPTIKFIKYLQQTSKPAALQPFLVANYIHDNYPGSLGQLDSVLPFDDDFISWLMNTYKLGAKGVPTSLTQIPAKYRKFFKLVESATSGSKHPLFYNSRYFVKDAVQNAVNSGKAAPQFSAKMLEALSENFIVLKTKIKANKFVTDVEWPAKMGGVVELVHKDPADKWGGALTWKLK